MKLEKTANKIIETYIIDNFSISEIINSDSLSQQSSYRPIHGLIFIIILSGKAIVQTNDKSYQVGQRMLISVAPFQSYFFTEQSEDFKYEYISFKLDFMADFPLILQPYVAEKMEKTPCLLLDKNNFKLLKSYYNDMLFQYKRSQHPSRINIIKAQLYVLVAEISYIYSQQIVKITGNHQEQITDDFLELLHTFYRKERKPAFYADKLCLSAKYLNKILKKNTGLTLYSWICEFVIKESKILLHSTDYSILQISDELNFPNASYFARYFKKYTGISPSEFRNQN